MKLRKFMEIPEGRPLDQIRPDGGFCGIFRTIGCIGDSLSSGEFESLDESGTTTPGASTWPGSPGARRITSPGAV